MGKQGLAAVIPLAMLFLLLSPFLFAGWSLWSLWNPQEPSTQVKVLISLVFVLYLIAYLIFLNRSVQQRKKA